jgi:small subunit ribosomal protein S10e
MLTCIHSYRRRDFGDAREKEGGQGAGGFNPEFRGGFGRGRGRGGDAPAS